MSSTEVLGRVLHSELGFSPYCFVTGAQTTRTCDLGQVYGAHAKVKVRE